MIDCEITRPESSPYPCTKFLQPLWESPLPCDMDPDLAHQMYGFRDVSRHLNCKYDHAKTLASEKASYSFTKADSASLVSIYQQLEQPAKGEPLVDLLGLRELMWDGWRRRHLLWKFAKAALHATY